MRFLELEEKSNFLYTDIYNLKKFYYVLKNLTTHRCNRLIMRFPFLFNCFVCTEDDLIQNVCKFVLTELLKYLKFNY